jgi:arylsulfatase A-like enzyme
VVQLAVLELPAMTVPALLAFAIPLASMVGVGGLLAPLVLLSRGETWHLLAQACVWSVVAVLATPASDLLIPLTLLSPAIALGLSLFGLWLSRRRLWLPPLAGFAMVGLALGISSLRAALAAAPAVDLAGRPLPAAGAPDVVLVVIDTVRRDRLGAYGYARETSPVFDGLARDGVLFDEAVSPGNWSLPSHASLFTGLFPSSHGAHSEHHRLREDLPTLAGLLAAAGWETVCFTANPWISQQTGLSRGFDLQDESWRRSGGGAAFSAPLRVVDWLTRFAPDDKGGAGVAEAFRGWLAQRPAGREGSGSRPYFAFLNFVEAHFPYHQLPDRYLHAFGDHDADFLRALSMELFADQFGGSRALDGARDRADAVGPARDMYDGGVLYTDALLGVVIDAVRARGTLDETLVVVLSDHGELLGEHDAFGHNRSLYEPELRVPLLIRHPAVLPRGVRVPGLVSTAGLMATLLELLDVEVPGHVQAGSLLPVVRGQPARGPVLSERFAQALPVDMASPDAPPMLREDLRMRAFRLGREKLVQTGDGGRFVFDLEADPDEEHDLAASHPDRVARLESRAAAWAYEIDVPPLDAEVTPDALPAARPDPATEAQLRALGYLE